MSYIHTMEYLLYSINNELPANTAKCMELSNRVCIKEGKH